MEKKVRNKEEKNNLQKEEARALFSAGTERKERKRQTNKTTTQNALAKGLIVVLFYSSRGCRRRARVKVKICVKMCFLCNYFFRVSIDAIRDDSLTTRERRRSITQRRLEEECFSFRFVFCHVSLSARGIDRLFLFARNADAMEKLSLSLNTTLLPAQSSSSPALPDASGKKSSRYFRNFRTRRFEPRHGTRASTR